MIIEIQGGPVTVTTHYGMRQTTEVHAPSGCAVSAAKSKGERDVYIAKVMCTGEFLAENGLGDDALAEMLGKRMVEVMRRTHEMMQTDPDKVSAAGLIVDPNMEE